MPGMSNPEQSEWRVSQILRRPFTAAVMLRVVIGEWKGLAKT